MSFEFDGEQYRKASAHQKEWGEKLIAEFDFTGSETILDLGCGDGAITAFLANHVPDGHVLGIDASTGMIKAAQKSFNRKNLRFELQDINSITFADEFDIVISNAALHWVQDHVSLLGRVHSSLKEGGIARFNFAAAENCSFFFTVVKEIMHLPEYESYFSSFHWPWFMPDIDAYRDIAAQFPFSQVTVWGENADRHFPDAEALIKWIDQPSIVPFLSSISSSLDAQRFRDAVVDTMLRKTAQQDGTHFETFRRVNFKAIK